MLSVKQTSTSGPSDAGALEAREAELAQLVALRHGDEAAFVALIERYHSAMLRVALVYVSDRAVAEEVVQETWLGVLNGLDRFQGRSSLKTWLFRILTNQAKTRGVRESRSVPFSALAAPDDEADEPAVDPTRFRTSEPWIGHFVSPLGTWDADTPEELLLSQETRAQIDQAIALLPAKQRQVIVLRDVEGWSADEVCELLQISETNQRVLLHRARSKVRGALERYWQTVQPVS